jgi:rubrerythrin
MNQEQFGELLLQALEHERGGIKVYETAIRCAVNDQLREEFEKYLEETRNHERILSELCGLMTLDPEAETPGRAIVRSMGNALVDAMNMAMKSGDKMAAQLVACESVVLAETKDHLNWELLGKCAGKLDAGLRKAFTERQEEVEEQEDEHLYHSKGWCRELWIEALGMRAILPPPEEEKHVRSAIGAARAEQSAPQRR